ncbi:MAG: alpha/beta hydrolase [Solirubrobacterales bacterium]
MIHGTGTDSGYFETVAGSLSETFRLITYDRRGWGRSSDFSEYSRTSIAEQAIEARGLLRDLDVTGVTVLGVGFGAVVALELVLSDPDLFREAILVEPPLFGLVTAATGGMSADVVEIRNAAEEGGKQAAYELFLDGQLNTLGCGARRLGARADRGPAAAHSFLVELPAVPAWPIDPQRLAAIETDVVVATMPSTPPLLMKAAEGINPRIPGSDRIETVRDGDEALTELLIGS